MAARCAQSTAVRPAPILRNRADAAFAIAADRDRNELLPHMKQAMLILSDGSASPRY